MAAPTSTPQWFTGGQNYFPAMLAAIAQARHSVELEIYIYAEDATGRRFRDALTVAAENGVRVRVLVDAGGSFDLAESFFTPLVQAGGAVKFFNPLRFYRFGVRDHRKLLVCDDETFFIGGANIADEYDGDGLTRGWFDLMVQQRNPDLAAQLRQEFDRLFTNAEFAGAKRQRLRALRPLRHHRGETQPFSVKPGRGAGGFQRELQTALATARGADFIVPYFLPPHRLRRLLRGIVRRGGRVRLLLPARCDVPVARHAAQTYYARLLRAGIELYEYQPQILHAKLYRVDGKTFAGSANLDVRSLKLNYELMLSFTDPACVESARNIFENALKHSRQIDLKEFQNSLTLWQRWKNRWAHFLLARIDPLIALRHLP